MIKIETEKIVEGNGNLSRILVNFTALKKNALPEKYLNGTKAVVYTDGSCRLICVKGTVKNLDPMFNTGEVIKEDHFQRLLAHCQVAGEHLKEVNQELAEKRATWNGKETFCI